MPYIKKKIREEIDYLMGVNPIFPYVKRASNGEFNYIITQICLHRPMDNYDEITDVIKTLRSVSHEIERRFLDPYEDLKIRENGDIKKIEKIKQKLMIE